MVVRGFEISVGSGVYGALGRFGALSWTVAERKPRFNNKPRRLEAARFTLSWGPGRKRCPSGDRGASGRCSGEPRAPLVGSVQEREPGSFLGRLFRSSIEAIITKAAGIGPDRTGTFHSNSSYLLISGSGRATRIRKRLCLTKARVARPTS